MSKSRNYYTLWLIYFMEYYEIIKHIFQRTMTWENGQDRVKWGKLSVPFFFYKIWKTWVYIGGMDRKMDKQTLKKGLEENAPKY